MFFRPKSELNEPGAHALWSVLLLMALLNPVAAGTAGAQPANDEYHVKAAFVFHFAQLVVWPAEATNESGSSLTLCTLEDDAFSDELVNTIQGRQIGSRTIRIRHVHLPQATRECNILVITKAEGKRLPLILAALRNSPVLTVGEGDNFLSSGGMIRFRIVQDKIRFDINLEAADSSHLKISSQLLLLANSVSRGWTDGGR